MKQSFTQRTSAIYLYGSYLLVYLILNSTVVQGKVDLQSLLGKNLTETWHGSLKFVKTKVVVSLRLNSALNLKTKTTEKPQQN